jgi:hypothetical protein
MSEIKRLIRYAGYDDWFLGLMALTAVAVGLFDFAGWLPRWIQERLLEITVVGVGLLMGTAFVQAVRQKRGLDMIRTMIGGVDVETLDVKWAFPSQTAQRVRGARKYILDTSLNRDVPHVHALSSRQVRYRRIRDERVRKDEIGFRRVEVIFHKQHLETVVRRLLMFEGHDFHVRHYDPPPQVIPILHIMSFDGEGFYLGGFYPSDSPIEERVVYVRSKEINELLRDYWHVLWLRGRPLNEGGVIDWTELKRIGKNVGMSDEEFEKMVDRLKGEVEVRGHQA